jgi:hypothetical protein
VAGVFVCVCVCVSVLYPMCLMCPLARTRGRDVRVCVCRPLFTHIRSLLTHIRSLLYVCVYCILWV